MATKKAVDWGREAASPPPSEASLAQRYEHIKKGFLQIARRDPHFLAERAHGETTDAMMHRDALIEQVLEAQPASKRMQFMLDYIRNNQPKFSK